MLEVRCYTCNNVVGHLWDDYMKLRLECDGKTCLDHLGLTRMCCRRMLLSHVPVIEDIVSYPNVNQTLDECNTMFYREVGHERTVLCD